MVAKPSHIPVLLQNRKLKWRIIVLGKQCGKWSLISMTSSMKVLTLERKSIGVSTMKLSVFIPFTIKQIINFTEAICMGISSLILITKKYM
jgi:hypothetical protein